MNPFSNNKNKSTEDAKSKSAKSPDKKTVVDSKSQSEKNTSTTNSLNPVPILKKSTTLNDDMIKSNAQSSINKVSTDNNNNNTSKVTTDKYGGKITKNEEAMKALNPGHPDAIVDIKISLSESQLETDLSKNSYNQLLPQELTSKQKKSKVILASTFNNKYSIWTWTRDQGTCSGRLKPIIEMQLETTGTSTDLVISGFTCIPISFNGKWLWIKV